MPTTATPQEVLIWFIRSPDKITGVYTISSTSFSRHIKMLE